MRFDPLSLLFVVFGAGLAFMAESAWIVFR